MQIESVRELKASLLKQHVEPLAARPTTLAARALGAKAVSSVDPVQRTLALGIAPHPAKGYALAVRVQTRGLESGPEIEQILKKAKGETDIRYIGRA
jgi:hypothetical protein